MLQSKARKYLRGRAHGLKPVVSIGKEGLTEALVAEIERTAASLELIKVRLLTNIPEQQDKLIEALAGRLQGEIVGRTGHVVIYFRPGKENSAYPELAQFDVV